MDCIFCGIVNGRIPSKKVFESDGVIAFEDIQKAAPIHVLIVPKRHMESIMDLPDDDFTLLSELQQAIREVARLTGASKSGFRVITNRGASAGQTVFHLHYHILGGRELERSLG
ncbi:MAG: histidine triad nucleotide-binding protein [Bacilli bacterium]